MNEFRVKTRGYILYNRGGAQNKKIEKERRYSCIVCGLYRAARHTRASFSQSGYIPACVYVYICVLARRPGDRARARERLVKRKQVIELKRDAAAAAATLSWPIYIPACNFYPSGGDIRRRVCVYICVCVCDLVREEEAAAGIGCRFLQFVSLVYAYRYSSFFSYSTQRCIVYIVTVA